jgi:hypothetical protein
MRAPCARADVDRQPVLDRPREPRDRLVYDVQRQRAPPGGVCARACVRACACVCACARVRAHACVRAQDPKIALAITILPDLDNPQKESTGTAGALARTHRAQRNADARSARAQCNALCAQCNALCAHTRARRVHACNARGCARARARTQRVHTHARCAHARTHAHTDANPYVTPKDVFMKLSVDLAAGAATMQRQPCCGNHEALQP